MTPIFLVILIVGVSNAVADQYTLCNYAEHSFHKCNDIIEVARTENIEIPLKCIKRKSAKACEHALKTHKADIAILTGHDYEHARKKGLKPVLFQKENPDNFYIAVAPIDIKFVSLFDAPIIVDRTDLRAFHAAVFFNYHRGHEICSFLSAANDGAYIRIVNSAHYVPNDNEILLCADGDFAFIEDYKVCNFEAGIQNAIFTRESIAEEVVADIKLRIFDTILEKFGHESKVNFFSNYHGHDDVLFKNNAVSFDLQPTYRNGVTEEVFEELHCDIGSHDHHLLD